MDVLHSPTHHTSNRIPHRGDDHNDNPVDATAEDAIFREQLRVRELLEGSDVTARLRKQLIKEIMRLKV